MYLLAYLVTFVTNSVFKGRYIIVISFHIVDAEDNTIRIFWGVVLFLFCFVVFVLFLFCFVLFFKYNSNKCRKFSVFNPVNGMSNIFQKLHFVKVHNGCSFSCTYVVAVNVYYVFIYFLILKLHVLEVCFSLWWTVIYNNTVVFSNDSQFLTIKNVIF